MWWKSSESAKRFSKLSEEVELRQELRSLSKENFQVVEEESQPQISQRVFDVLRQQLKIFGYRSEEQQMLFLNRLLGSDHKVLSDLSPQELRQVFAEIHRYNASPMNYDALAQSA